MSKKMVSFFSYLMLAAGLILVISFFGWRYYSSKVKYELEQNASNERGSIEGELKNVYRKIDSSEITANIRQDSLLAELEKTQAASKNEIKKALEKAKASFSEKKYDGKDPYIRLSTKGIYVIEGNDENDYDRKFRYYRAHFDRNEAPATNLDIETKLLFEFKVNGKTKYHLHEHEFFELIDDIPIGTMDAPFGQSLKTLTDTKFFIYFKGSYTNLSGTNKYQIDKLYEYDNSDKKTRLKVGSEKKKIIKIISSFPSYKNSI